MSKFTLIVWFHCVVDLFYALAMLGLLYGLTYNPTRSFNSASCVQVGWAASGLSIYALMDANNVSVNVWAATIPLVLFCGRILAWPCKTIRESNLVAVMVNYCVLLISSFIYIASVSQDSMLEQGLTEWRRGLNRY